MEDTSYKEEIRQSFGAVLYASSVQRSSPNTSEEVEIDPILRLRDRERLELWCVRSLPCIRVGQRSESAPLLRWTHGYECLDTELRQVVREAELGKRLADVLVKVWRKDGRESWLLIHIEVQGRPEEGFAERLFVYHYRIFDRYNRQVVTLAVLADDMTAARGADRWVTQSFLGKRLA